MDDRELLELAAKAAGMHKLTEWSDGIWDHDSPHYGYPALHEAGPGGACGSWNPLTDDGDALRLAITLGLTVECDFHDSDTCTAYQTRGDIVADEQAGMVGEVIGEPDFAATRRAIVRAAAEIGRAM